MILDNPAAPEPAGDATAASDATSVSAPTWLCGRCPPWESPLRRQAVGTTGSLTRGLLCQLHVTEFESEQQVLGLDRILETVTPLPNLPLPDGCLCRIDLHWDDSPEYREHGKLWTYTVGIGCPLHYKPLPVKRRIAIARAKLDRAAGLL